MAYTHVPDSQRQKLDSKAVKLRFVGYSIQSKGYRLIDEQTSTVYTHRDVVFTEQDFKEATILPELIEIRTEASEQQFITGSRNRMNQKQKEGPDDLNDQDTPQCVMVVMIM